MAKGLSTSSTNGDGEYFFESLENGTYSILAEHEGKKGVAHHHVVGEGQGEGNHIQVQHGGGHAICTFGPVKIVHLWQF